MGYPAERTIVHSIGVDVERFKPPAPAAAGKDRALCWAAGGEEGLWQPDRRHGRGAAPQPGSRVGGHRRWPIARGLRGAGRRAGRTLPLLGYPASSRGAGMDGAGGVFCVPSVVAASGDAEGFGMVFIEAQAMGLPVVSTLSGGIPEAVKHGETGLLVTERDPAALAEAILRLLRTTNCGSASARRAEECCRLTSIWPSKPAAWKISSTSCWPNHTKQEWVRDGAIDRRLTRERPPATAHTAAPLLSAGARRIEVLRISGRLRLSHAAL